MLKAKYLCTLAFVFLVLPCLAQNGYDIGINVKNAKDETMSLSFYDGTYSKAHKIDSVLITASQQMVHFKTADRIIGGIYQLSFKNSSINIAIDNDAKLQFDVDGIYLPSLKSQQKLNADFLLLQKATTSLGGEKQRLQQLIIDYPQSVIALFSKFELKKIAASPIGDIEKVALRAKYFSDVDLQDKRIPLLPNAYSYLFGFVNLLPINDSTYQNNADFLMNGMTCQSRNYFFYLNWLFEDMAYYERYQLNNAYRYVYSMYLDKDGCKTADTKLYDRFTKQMATLDELAIGKTIPAFIMQDSSGNIYDIKNVMGKSKYTFVAFYDPDCSHCQKTMPEVAEYFSNDKFDNKLVQKIAFVNARDTSKWQAFIQTAKLQNWMNVKPANGDMNYFKDLKVYSNPSFFLLDDKGTILLKSYNKDAINAILNSH